MRPIAHKYFSPWEKESVWQDQLYLNLLATHPSWDGNGFAARQVRWGMKLSRREDEARSSTVPVTLLATPAGWPLYESLGFEGVENATISMLDGLGELWSEVCRWDG